VDVLKVLSSSTGAPIGTLTVPDTQVLQSVTSLGNDHTFVATAFDRSACLSHLWKFTIDSAGKPSKLAPLSLPQHGRLLELTASADGTTLGYNVQRCEPGEFQVGILNLVTDQTTRWDFTDDPSGLAGVPDSLSLTADGSVLGFSVISDFSQTNPPSQAFTIPTDTPAGPLVSQAHPVPGLGVNAIRAIPAPDGDQLYVEAFPQDPNDPVALNLINTSTGALVRKVEDVTESGKDLAFPTLILDNSGQHMLVYGGATGPGFADVQELDVASGQVTATVRVTDPELDGSLNALSW
jgi:hypothetical protein